MLSKLVSLLIFERNTDAAVSGSQLFNIKYIFGPTRHILPLKWDVAEG